MTVTTVLIVLVLAVGLYMAWNIGANDVSNAMGTSVGSGALTLARAIIIAAILEFLGAFLLGANVSETMQKGLINPDTFIDTPQVLFYGMFAALLGTSIWLQIASYAGWPVSTTHAIVGAIVGFGIVGGGASSIHWPTIGSIAISWIISPLLSALFSYVLFIILQRKILYASSPIRATKRLIPFLTAALFATFTLSAFFGGLKNLSFHLSIIQSFGITLAVSACAFLISWLFVGRVHLPHDEVPRPGPYQLLQLTSLEKTLKHLQRLKHAAVGIYKQEVDRILGDVHALSQSIRKESGFERRQSDYRLVERMFGFLQICSAAYVAFAHGANDVANAIGPVAAALDIVRSGRLSATTHIPVWLLLLGGGGIVLGLATWGWRVIQTVGKKITELTPTRGFSAEFGAAVTILIASKAGLPISTTHCIVGSVLGVGLARGLSALNLRMIRDIVLSWIITIPSSALVTIGIFYLIKLFLL